MRTSRRLATAVIIAAVATVGVYAYALADPSADDRLAVRTRSATAATTTTAVVPTYGPIALVGDSLSVQATLEEQARLQQAGWSSVTHNATFGRRVPWDANTHTPYSGIAAVNAVRSSAGDPRTWIVELGTNDVSVTGNDAGSIRTVIDSMLAVIGPGHRIVWVNVHNGLEPAASATFNRVLDEVAAQRADLVVADWAGVAEAPGHLMDDEIHLTPEGRAAFAAVIAAAADQAALLP